MKISKKRLEKMSKDELIKIIFNFDNNLKVCEENYSRLNYEILDNNKEHAEKVAELEKTVRHLTNGYDNVVRDIQGTIHYVLDNMIKNDNITIRGCKDVIYIKEEVMRITYDERYDALNLKKEVEPKNE